MVAKPQTKKTAAKAPEPPPVTPYHKWTNGGSKVRILKTVDRDRKAHAGFQWPESGEVLPEGWNPEPVCGYGLHGWAWGLGMGDGKTVNFVNDLWIVFEADAEDVVLIQSKVKAKKGNVIYCGAFVGAQALVIDGQIAWTQHASRGSSSATGTRGSSSATGDAGSSSATGTRGSSSATGTRGIAATTGEDSKLEVSETGLAATTAERVSWCHWNCRDVRW